MEQTFFQKYKTWILIIGFVLLIVFGSTIFNGIRKTITLNVWGSGFSEEQFDLLSKNIKKTSKNPIKFVYTEIDIDDYEQDLLDSFIHSESPDIFLINNTQLGKFKKLISPMILEGKYNAANLQKDFPTIISTEAVINNGLMMMPLSIDSLAMYFNRNIFDSLAIPTPPTTWISLVSLIPSLRQLDSYNRISRAPIGMGDSKTITNSMDILALLIMQLNGKIIDTAEQRVMIGERSKVNDQYVNSAEESLKFYCQFSQSNNQNYSWNSSFGNDIEAFANNKLATYIGYFSDRNLINEKNPNLIFGVSEMPQLNSDNNVNFGRFWGFTVSAQSKNKNVAWEALQALTTPENMQGLLNFSKFPPANRNLISQYYNDPDLAIFAKQALNSKSFYMPDGLRTKESFWETIDNANQDQNYKKGVGELSQSLTNLMYNN